MTKWKFTSLFALFALPGGMLWAQPKMEIAWQKTIGGDLDDGSRLDVANTPDGGYVLLASSSSGISGEKTVTGDGYWIIKTDAAGVIEWQKNYNGDSRDDPASIASTQDGGYILGGTSNSGVSGAKTEVSRGGNDYWILKLNKDGNIEWQKTIGGDGDDALVRVVPSPDGGYIVGGTSRSTASGDKTEGPKGGRGVDLWVVKLKNTGDIAWQKTIGTDIGSDNLMDVIPTLDGGFLVSGSTTNGISGDKTEASKGRTDYWLIKLNATGTIEWDKAVGGTQSESQGKLVQTADSGFVVCGSSDSPKSADKTEANRGGDDLMPATPGRGWYDVWMVKIDKNGTGIEWQRSFGGSGTDEFCAIQPTLDGGFVLSISSNSPMSGEKDHQGFGGYDVWILKLNPAGNIEWQKTMGGMDDEVYVGTQAKVIQKDSRSYLMVSSSNSGISGEKTDSSRGGRDIWMVKLFEACPDTTFIAEKVCSSTGYALPWGETVYTSGTYTYVYPPQTEGSFCDSTVQVALELAVDTAVVQNGETLTAQDNKASYQWIDCSTGQPVPGANEASYSPGAKGGRYAVIVSLGDCIDTSACYEISSTGIAAQNLASALQIYPNPAHNMITLTSTGRSAQIVEVRINNMLGQELYRKEGRPVLQEYIPVGHWANGIYLVRVKTKEGEAALKLQVQH